MEKLIPFHASDLTKITHYRSGEIKFGEKMITVPKGANITTFIKSCPARYVLLGIPEDIGVRANFGRPGAASAWESTLKSIANIQYNRFCKGNELLILGQLDVSEEMKAVENLNFHHIADRKKLSDLVVSIDKEVAHIVSIIVKSGKIPIVVGGGHNNSYGNIKGAALAKGKTITAVSSFQNSKIGVCIKINSIYRFAFWQCCSFYIAIGIVMSATNNNWNFSCFDDY